VSSYNTYTLYSIPNINEFFPDSNKEYIGIPDNIYTYDVDDTLTNEFEKSIEKYAQDLSLYIVNDENVSTLLKPFGEQALNTFHKLDPTNKEKFVAYALMFLKGGFYINKNIILTNDIKKLGNDFTMFCDTSNSVKVIVSKKGNPVFHNLLNSSSSQFYINDIQDSYNVKKMEEIPICDTSISNSCSTVYTSKISYNKETFAIYNKFGQNWLNKYVNKVYIIAMPNRVKYMTDFMNIINQKNFDFIQPIDKTTILNPYEYTDNLNLSAGKIACHLSHIKALKTFLNSSHETCFIFEDDLMLPDGTNVEKGVDDFFSNLPGNWEILFLGRCWDWCHDSVVYNKYVCSNPRPLCRHAYVVNKSAAKKLVDYTNIMYMEAGDHMYADLIRKGILQSYSPYESLFIQNRTTLSTQVMYTNPNLVTCAPTLRNNKKKTICVVSTRDLTINEKYQFADNRRLPYYYIVKTNDHSKKHNKTLEDIGLLEAEKEKYSDEFVVVKDAYFIYDDSKVIKKLNIKNIPKYEVLNRDVVGETTIMEVKI